MIIACGEALIDMVPERNAEGRDVYVPCLGGSPYNTAIAAGRLLGGERGKEPAYIFYTEGAADRSFSAEDIPAFLPGIFSWPPRPGLRIFLRLE
jgi:fructokinase